MRLEKASHVPPKGLQDFLVDLGEGENGFSGTPVHNGKVSLQEYLKICCDMSDESELKPGLVPQTVFWLLDSDDEVVGMVKVRHRLNENTHISGGHIGFFVHPSHRGKGYGKQALALALTELEKIGVLEVLLTVYPENKESKRIVESNGGRYSDTVFDQRTKHEISRYWINLKP
jgi:predicted acetyltransferase